VSIEEALDMSQTVPDRERLIQLFLRLAPVNALPLAENAIAQSVGVMLRDAGVRVVEDNAASGLGGTSGNLLCFPPDFQPDRPSVMLTAHLDTVLPTLNLKPIVTAERISSDGTTILGGDNRLGVSILAHLLLRLAEAPFPHRNFFVAFTVAEEIGLRGATAIDLTPYKVQSVFVFDCSRRPGVYIKECVGLSLFSARYVGKASHAGVAPQEGINAIALASAGISKLKMGRVDEDTTVNIGRISGGEASNIVPDNVEVDGEVRSFHKSRLQDELKHIERTLSEPAAGGGKLLFETKSDFEPYAHAGDAPIVLDVEKAMKRAGLSPQPIRYTGGSDANVYNARGIPAVNLGIGAQKPHSFEEFILIEDLVKSAELAFSLVGP
jgi:tripeptide aminopeptidase